MIIKNNKGFMLIEVIVASAILIGTMVGLYKGFSRLYTNYTELSKYNNVDAIYASKLIEEYLIDEFEMNDIITTLNDPSTSIAIKQNDDYYSNCNDYCKAILVTYNVENMYIFKKGELASLSVTNQTFKDYLTYLTGNLIEENIIIVTEIKNEDSYYYGYLKVEWQV